MPRDLLTPPKYAPHAIATERGWEDPKTGELYVSLRGLKGLQKELKKKLAAEKRAAKKKTPKKEVKTDEVEQEIAPSIEEPVPVTSDDIGTDPDTTPEESDKGE